MASRTAILLFMLAFLKIELSLGFALKGKVSCLDCESNNDLSGIMVLVKCEHVKKVATTTKDGSFKALLPLSSPMSLHPSNCFTKLLGGPNQLYASKKNMVSKVVKLHNSGTYIISNNLNFWTSCPKSQKDVKCSDSSEFGSSKTVDLPLPPEWGFAPSSYYVPFFPIIGIP